MASPDITPGQHPKFVTGKPKELWTTEEIKSLEWSGFDGKRVTLFKGVRADGRSNNSCYGGCQEKPVWTAGATITEPHSELKFQGGGLYASSLTLDWVDRYVRRQLDSYASNIALVVEAQFEHMLWYNNETTAIKSSQLTVLDARVANPEFAKLFPRLGYLQRERVGRDARSWDDVLRILSEPKTP